MKKNNLTLTTIFMSLLLIGGNILTSCNNDDNQSKESRTGTEILSSTAWVTSAVIDQNNVNIDRGTVPGANYVGYAYYKTDGTFRIVSLQDQPRIAGKWELIDNDTKRRLTIIRNDTTVVAEVDIVTLKNNLFTYRAIPDRSNPTSFFNVEHIPTNHKEPSTPAEVLASVNWTTTKVSDITNGAANAVELDKAVAPASNFFGDAYYVNSNGSAYFPVDNQGRFTNGTFRITDSGSNQARISGDWYVSLDGRQRTLRFRNAAGVELERVVSIFELTPTKFTYDVTIDGGRILRAEHEPIR